MGMFSAAEADGPGIVSCQWFAAFDAGPVTSLYPSDSVHAVVAKAVWTALVNYCSAADTFNSSWINQIKDTFCFCSRKSCYGAPDFFHKSDSLSLLLNPPGHCQPLQPHDTTVKIPLQYRHTELTDFDVCLSNLCYNSVIKMQGGRNYEGIHNR